jgi:hypothetical protein
MFREYGRMANLLSVCVLSAALAAPAAAQDEAARKKAAEEAPLGWTQEMIGGLGFTQTEFENYAEGGESSLTWTSSLQYRLRQRTEKRFWLTEGYAEFGQTKLGTEEIRKATDRLRVTSLHLWTLGAWVDPFIALDAQTQFASGYDYATDPKTETSRFMNPFYFRQSAGVSKTLAPGLKTRLGVALDETIVTDEAFASRYTDDDPADGKLDKSRIQTGIESVTRFERSFDEGRLDVLSELMLFSKFESPDKVDVYWVNKFTAKVLDYIGIVLATEVRYDEDIIKRTQFKEVLSIGLTHTFF